MQETAASPVGLRTRLSSFDDREVLTQRLQSGKLVNILYEIAVQLGRLSLALAIIEFRHEVAVRGFRNSQLFETTIPLSIMIWENPLYLCQISALECSSRSDEFRTVLDELGPWTEFRLLVLYIHRHIRAYCIRKFFRINLQASLERL